jgi:hypothetical protein
MRLQTICLKSRLLIALLILFPAVAAAEERFVYGMGSDTSCGQYIAANEGRKLISWGKVQQNGITYVSENRAMFEWVRGVLTGVNLARDSQHQIQTDNAALDLWFRNWCTKNPTKMLMDAISILVDETPGTPLRPASH